MRKTILICSAVMLSVLSLYASNNIQEERGFTVTYLMLEKQNIKLPQDQIEEDTNSSEQIEYEGGDTKK
jgi:hypothetical protein